MVSFSLLEKASYLKSSRHILRFVAAYLQVRNKPAGDRPRPDFLENTFRILCLP